MSKYKAVRTNGYASGLEARRAAELELMEKASLITNLKKQSRFILLPAAPEAGYRRPLVYVADFEYIETRTAKWCVEDCKGYPTPAYMIKRRLLKQLHGIDIIEIRK